MANFLNLKLASVTQPSLCVALYTCVLSAKGRAWTRHETPSAEVHMARDVMGGFERHRAIEIADCQPLACTAPMQGANGVREQRSVRLCCQVPRGKSSLAVFF